MPSMKICYFADANNYHTQKWVCYFASQGNEIHVLSLDEPAANLNQSDTIRYHWLSNKGDKAGKDFQKLSYLTTIGVARKILNTICPDIVHAHYASSYGLVCALSCKKPFFLSVWGKDVYDFPKKSLLHRIVLKFSLNRSTWLLSTSKAMAKETKQYTRKPIEITPFGVDMELFHPVAKGDETGERIVIGTVKSLEKKYGIDVLLKAIKVVREACPQVPIQVRIAGKGSEERVLKSLTRDLGIEENVVWLGFISQIEAAQEWAGFDIAVIPSVDESESFGVSAVEAQACGCATVISDIPGLLEACNDGATALVVPRGNVELLADAILSLMKNPQKRYLLGGSGRRYVENEYGLKKCFQKVEKLYARSIH